MSGISTKSPQQQGGPAPGTYQSLIDQRLARTRAQVKGVDVAAGLMVLSGAALGYLLVATVVDQWLLVGGLGFRGRVGLFAVLVVVGGWYFVRRVLPTITRRINPIYAAETIERSRPSLKNSLINFLMLRRQAKELPPVIYRAVEYQAAADVSQVNVEAAVDHGRVIRLGYLLIALVALGALYLVFSPKNPLVSFGRVIWPWANIDAPTRVRFTGVQPGDTKKFRGEFLEISAEVAGLKGGEPVAVYYSSADSQIVNEAVPMAQAQGDYRYSAKLPPDSLGLQQDLQYYLAAGDSRTRTFKVDVQVSPVVNVDRLEYHYPAYTGIPDRVVEGEGDIRAIEGTRVTIHATANEEIARAQIDLGCDSLHLERMTPNGSEAKGEIVLRTSKEDPVPPEAASYQIRFTDGKGRENRQPIRHRIEVIRDLPPEVEILAPEKPEVAVAVNGQLEIRVRALDPDFGLRRVALQAERDKEALKIAPLMERPRPGDPHKGEFKAAYLFQPARLGLKAGDLIRYWAAADDNKYLSDEEPKPNRSETDKKTIRIVGADQEQQTRREQEKQADEKPHAGEQGRDQHNERPQDKQGDKGQNQQQQQQPQNQAGKPQDQQEGQGQQDKEKQQGQGQQGQEGQQGQGQQGQGQQGKPPGQDPAAGQKQDQQSADKQSQKQPVDGDTNPGDAFDKIMQDQQPEQGKGKEEQPDRQKQDQLAQKSDEKQDKQPGEQKGQPGEQKGQPGEQKGQPGEQKGQPGEQKGQPGEQKGQPGEQKGQPGEQKGQPGEQKGQPGEQKGQPGEQKGQPGEQKGQPGEQKGQPGEQKGQPGEQKGQPGEQKGQPGEQKGQPGEQKGQPGEQKGQPGEQKGQPGEQKGQPGEQKGQPGEQKGQPQGSGQDKQQGAGEQQMARAEPKAGDKQQSGDQKAAGGKQSEKEQASSAGKKGQGDQKQSASPGDQGKDEKQGQGGEPAERRQAGGEPGKQVSPDASKQKTPGQEGSGSEQAKAEPGQGAKAPGDREHTAQQPREGELQQKPEAKGGDPQGSTGKPGAGKPSDAKAGSPSPQEGNQPRDKKAGTPEGMKPDSRQDQAQSPSNSPKDSDSKGETAGDRSGGGEKGGGQKANQSGTGSAGTHTAADQGGSKSDQKGDGQTGQRAGDQSQSKNPTGSTAKQQGQGSRTADSGDQQAGKEGNSSGKGDQQGKSSSAGDASSNPQGPKGDPSGTVQAGGEQAKDNIQPKTEEAGGDDPDLRYAAKQTDLTLRRSRHELAKDKPNADMLKRLGWSRDELAKFYERWSEMKRAADQDSPAGPARKKFNEAVKSLGLRPQATQLKGGATTQDQVRNLRESLRADPPPEWREYLKAYTEGVAGKK